MEPRLEKSRERLGMRWVVEEGLLFDAASLLLAEVYAIHEKTYQWAYSAVKDWPAVVVAFVWGEINIKLFD